MYLKTRKDFQKMKETKNVISRNGKNQWTTNRKKLDNLKQSQYY